MESLAGHLLVASPQLADPNFARTLVLLVQHAQEGAFGLVLNRPIRKNVQELWREVGSGPCHSRQPIHLGGPVPGPLMALHTNCDLAELEPVPGLYFAAKKQNLDTLVLDDQPTYKIFVGHAGWGAGQLENELHQGAWRSVAATKELVFSQAENLWEAVFRELGHSVLKSLLNLKELPNDPTLN